MKLGSIYVPMGVILPYKYYDNDSHRSLHVKRLGKYDSINYIERWLARLVENNNLTGYYRE